MHAYDAVDPSFMHTNNTHHLLDLALVVGVHVRQPPVPLELARLRVLFGAVVVREKGHTRGIESVQWQHRPWAQQIDPSYLGRDGVLEIEAGQLPPRLRLGLIGQLVAQVEEQLRLSVLVVGAGRKEARTAEC